MTEVAVSEPKSVVSSSEKIMGLSRIDTPLTDGRAINVEGDVDKGYLERHLNTWTRSLDK